MTMVDRLIEQLEKRGLRIEPGPEPGQLVLRGPNDQKTESVLAALKKFKPQLLEKFALKTEFVPQPNDEPDQSHECDPEPDPEDERGLADFADGT